MVVEKIVAIREAVAHKIGKRVGAVEASAHLFYGSVVFTEFREGITLYGVAALTLGVISVIAVIFGEDR